MTPSEISTNQLDIQLLEGLAYENFIKEGRPSGRDVQHWLDAERKLRDVSLVRNASLMKCADEGIKDIMLNNNLFNEHSSVHHLEKRHAMTTTQTTVKDPICGMQVDPKTAISAEKDGKKSYFCGEGCRKKFMATPAGTTPKGTSGGCCG